MIMELTLKITDDIEVIRAETKKLRNEIDLKYSEIELLYKALRHYTGLCTHPGQKTGYNERDGSWANPCPVCGESH